MSNLTILRARVSQGVRLHVQQLRYAALATSVFTANAMAQVGGGTGTGDAVQARMTGTMTTAQAILYGVGALIMSGAFLYTAYGIAWGGKKWSELGNVAGAMVAGGVAVMACGWLFS